MKTDFMASRDHAQGSTGAIRARALLSAKATWATGFYAHAAPAPTNRQAVRAWARAQQDHKRPDATDRGHISRRVIAAGEPRKRQSPKPAARFAPGMKHAWQRKAAFWAAMRKAAGQ